MEYQLETLELINEGSFGKVYRVNAINLTEKQKEILETKENTKKVIVKVMDTYKNLNNYVITNIDMNEINAISLKNLSNIITYYDFFFIEKNKKICIIMEDNEGESLDYAIKEKKYNFNQKINICKEILKGLFQLNSRNIIHRDLKPENVIIDKNNNVKLIDFGVNANNFCEREGKKFNIYTSRFLYILPKMIENLNVVFPEQYNPILCYNDDLWAFFLLCFFILTETDFYDENYDENIMIKKMEYFFNIDNDDEENNSRFSRNLNRILDRMENDERNFLEKLIKITKEEFKPYDCKNRNYLKEINKLFNMNYDIDCRKNLMTLKEKTTITIEKKKEIYIEILKNIPYDDFFIEKTYSHLSFYGTFFIIYEYYKYLYFHNRNLLSLDYIKNLTELVYHKVNDYDHYNINEIHIDFIKKIDCKLNMTSYYNYVNLLCNDISDEQKLDVYSLILKIFFINEDYYNVVKFCKKMVLKENYIHEFDKKIMILEKGLSCNINNDFLFDFIDNNDFFEYK